MLTKFRVFRYEFKCLSHASYTAYMYVPSGLVFETVQLHWVIVMYGERDQGTVVDFVRIALDC
jgi:hypothetical protein